MGRLFGREVVLNVAGTRIASRTLQQNEVKTVLRVGFSVVRDLKKNPNTVDVTIYNLRKDTRTRLQTKNLPTRLEAGYIDNVSQIFSGDLQYGNSLRNGPDWITTLQSGDGNRQYKSARINTSFKGPISPGQVLRRVGQALGLNLGNLTEKADKGSLRASLKQFGDIVLSGKAEQELTKITKSMGYSWSIQDGQLQLLEPNETIKTADPVLLTNGTGLVGSPEAGEDGVVSARSLLQPDLLPGRRVRIQSREIDGFFRVEKVTFSGDTWARDWYSDIEAKPL